MKNVLKRTLSAAIAVLTMSVTAMSAMAADYAQAPSFSETPSATVSVKTETVKEAVSDAIKNAEDGVAAVKVKNTNNLKLSSAILKSIAKLEGGSLVIESPKAIISIDADSIEKARNIDLSMKVNSNSEKTVINMTSRVKFGCKVKIAVTNCKLSAEALKEAHVYCNGKDLGLVELDENGYPVITVTAGGTYTIK